MALADVQRKIIDALEQLLTLEVSTVVWDAEHGDRDITTEIKLVTGDIKTRMHADFISGDLASLRDFHAEQVTQGQKIIADHVRTLLDLINELRGKEEAAPDQA